MTNELATHPQARETMQRFLYPQAQDASANASATAPPNHVEPTATIPPPLPPLLVAVTDRVQDPQVRFALACCQDRISEPPLCLRQIREAVALLRPGGNQPCARTIQRWVRDKGFPCFFDQVSEQRVYRLSACIDWFSEHCPTISIAQSATSAAQQVLLRKGRNDPRLRIPA